MRLHDWNNLKHLIEGKNGFAKKARWGKPVIVDPKNIQETIDNNPELLEIVLAAPNIAKLSGTSLEALDRLAIRIFEVKKETIDLILKRLGESSSDILINFASLLKDLRLSQVSMLSSIIYQKLRIVDLLEKITSNSTKNEDAVHEIFENNCWLLGRAFEIVQSDKSLAKYLDTNIKKDPETCRRPDLIIKRIPYSEKSVLVELKSPKVKLAASHIGQVLGYKAIIEQNKPNIKEISCFLFGYEKSSTFTLSKDVSIKTFSELIDELRDEFGEYIKILEEGREE